VKEEAFLLLGRPPPPTLQIIVHHLRKRACVSVMGDLTIIEICSYT